MSKQYGNYALSEPGSLEVCIMLDQERESISSALNDFRRARDRARLEEIMASLTGRSAALLSYDEVKEKLKAGGGSARGLREIPLAAIVGSVGRYTDFTRSFLPRHDSDAHRWAGVQLAATGLVGLPPIDVYQIGDVYFVLDGNHRVSVARQLGATHIEAYVTEVHTKVPLTPDVRPDDLIIKARYADFLERTRLDELRPDADLSVTVPGQYRVLEKQIELRRERMAEEQQRETSVDEAVTDWYDSFYLPVIKVIREQGILRDFPGRTETDLYAWVAEHRELLEKELGWQIKPEVILANLATQLSPRPERVIARVGERLLDAVTPDALESGPAPGRWRREWVEPRRDDRLFPDILVALDGEAGGWLALDYALQVAQREDGRLLGLHVVASDALKETEPVQMLQDEFQRRCQAVQVPGEFAVEAGPIARKICERAWWADLVTVSLTHPPASQLLAKLGPGFHTLVRRSARPILAVPTFTDPVSMAEAEGKRLERALLAYDGSPKAQEALFVAAYLAGAWQIPLVVVTVMDKNRTAAEALDQAKTYLTARSISASYVAASGPVAEAILQTSATQQSDLLIMGGYGSSPMLEVVLGSSVDQILRQTRQPLLICR
jgi:nucleotide-binding universal stress UspA family protein